MLSNDTIVNQKVQKITKCMNRTASIYDVITLVLMKCILFRKPFQMFLEINLQTQSNLF